MQANETPPANYTSMPSPTCKSVGYCVCFVKLTAHLVAVKYVTLGPEAMSAPVADVIYEPLADVQPMP
jgi:hypothetical protein